MYPFCGWGATVAGALAAGCGYLASIVHTGWLGFPLGLVAILAAFFILYAPSEIYKAKKRHREFLVELDRYINSGTVAACRIKASRIAIAEEYEDESELFIIETGPDEILCLWDYEYTLRKRLPCHEFDIYEDRFARLLRRLVYPLSERIQPLIIDKKAKWSYISRVGLPEHMEVVELNFDQVVEEILSNDRPGRLANK